MITCRFEDGKETHLRHCTADVVALDDQGRTLLVRRALFLVEGGKLALPGGYMDPGETWQEAALREFREESGYDCSGLRLFNVDSRAHRRGNERMNVAAIFLAQAGEWLRDPDHESTELLWVDVREAATLDLAFDHADQLRLVVDHLDRGFRLPLMDGVELREQ